MTDYLPIPFIVGMPRAGKTLLRMMLDSHPEMAIPPDTHFLPLVFQMQAYGSSARSRFLETLTHFYTWNDFHLDEEHFAHEVSLINPFNSADAVRTFYKLYARRFEKQRWGDKTPEYGYSMQAIHSLLPEAHFIHVLRDGRDNAVSQKSSYMWRFDGVTDHAREWRRRLWEYRRQARQSGAPYLEIRFEDLVTSTEAVLRKVCAFINLPWRDEMTTYYERSEERFEELADLDFPLERVPRSERVSLYRMLSGKPDPLQIGIWKTELTSEEISSYHQVCGKTLGELGYSVTEPIDADKGINDGPLIRPGRAPIVKNVDRVLIQLPYRSVPGRNMLRENPLWNLFDICIVTLDNGVRGIGETMVEYTHRQVTDADIQFVMGQNAADVMWSDQVGCGLQQALFDAVAKSLDVPLYALLGNKTKDKLQIGWWAIDMPSDDLRSEMNSAIAQGYTSMKMKGRPWFDLRQQLRAIADSAPKGFRIHVDFNELITDAAAVKDYLNILRDFPIVNICEELIPQSNTNACRRLSARCDVAFARHVQSSQMIVKMASEAACDGVVLGRLGIAERLAQASAAVASRIHICNQQVGSSITAAFALHCGAVMQGPSWPAIACHNLYEEEVVRNRIEVDKGWATIPEAPGIGVDIDMQALDRYAVRSGSNPIRRPEQLIVITYPNGFSQDYTETSVYWRDYAEGRMPSSNEGVVLEALVDDGSRAWRQRYGKALLRAMSLRT